VLGAIASAHGKSIAQVVLRWLMQRQIVTIPKSVKRERMTENFAVWDFVLSEEEMLLVASLDLGESQFFSHRDPAWVRGIGERQIHD